MPPRHPRLPALPKPSPGRHRRGCALMLGRIVALALVVIGAVFALIH